MARPRSRSSHGVIVEQRTRPARGLKAAGARPGGARRRPHLAGLPCTCNTMRTSAVWPGAAGSHQDTPTNTTRRTLVFAKSTAKSRRTKRLGRTKNTKEQRKNLRNSCGVYTTKLLLHKVNTKSLLKREKLEGAQRSCHPLRLIFKAGGRSRSSCIPLQNFTKPPVITAVSLYRTL